MPRKYSKFRNARRNQRLQRLQELEALISQRMKEADKHRDRIALPPTIEGFMEYVFWPHVETKQPISGLSLIGEDYLSKRSCFRWDPVTGERIAGSDIVMKPRRAFLTTLAWACIFYCLIRWSQLRSVTAFQVGDQDEIVEPAIGKISYMLERLPQEWLGDWRRKGSTIYLGSKRWIGDEVGFDGPERSGGAWTPISSGHTPQVADKRGRSADCDIFHASETCVIPYPEPLFSAVGEALPAATGMLLSESTLPETREQFQAAEYFRTKNGTGRFLKHFFYTWHQQPFKRIPRNVPEFDKFMSPEFEATVPREELAKESRLGLTAEQCAFRRKQFFTGSPEKRRKARRENPESDHEAFVSESPHFDIDAIERAMALTQPPINDQRHPLGRHFGISIWDMEPEGFLILGVDVAQKDGKDFTAVVALDGRTFEQIAEIHGRALASEMAEAIEWLLKTLDRHSKRWHCVVIESNHGKALIAECLNRKLRLYSEVAKTKSRKQKRTIRRWGITTQGYNRNKIIDAIAEGVEGPRLDEFGEPRELGPQAPIRSEYLVDEIKHMVWNDKKRRVEADAGHHDDLPIAYGLARFAAPQIRMPGSWSGLTGPEDSGRYDEPKRGSRHLQLERRGRRGSVGPE